jgi:hypothetical protein
MRTEVPRPALHTVVNLSLMAWRFVREFKNTEMQSMSSFENTVV